MSIYLFESSWQAKRKKAQRWQRLRQGNPVAQCLPRATLVDKGTAAANSSQARVDTITYFKIMLSLLPLPLLLLPLLLWPSYICQVRPRTVFFLFELCCHACPCAVPNHPWLCPTSVGVLRQSWPRQGRKPPTAGRKTTANGWLIDFSAHPARRP